MAETVNVKGLSELYRVMDELTPKLERNVMRGGLRAGMKVVQPVAKQLARKASGVYADGLKIGTRSRGGTVTASLKATGPHAYIGKWLEWGTRPHTITAREGGALAIGGGFYKSVEHPGTKPYPHMRPALDTQATAAVVAVGEYIKLRLATKHGLDTANIIIEGDES